MMQLVVFYHVMELISSRDVYSEDMLTEVPRTVVGTFAGSSSGRFCLLLQVRNGGTLEGARIRIVARNYAKEY